jgi:hypothetical protein
MRAASAAEGMPATCSELPKKEIVMLSSEVVILSGD